MVRRLGWTSADLRSPFLHPRLGPPGIDHEQEHGDVLRVRFGTATRSDPRSFAAGRTGLLLSLATTIGGVLGEFLAGPVIDRRLDRSRKAGQKIIPEQRLLGLAPAPLIFIAGFLIFGLAFQFKLTYVAVAIGMALTCLALQVVTTPICAPTSLARSDHLDAYLTDAFKPQSAEIAQVLNVCRQTLAFTVPWWANAANVNLGFGASVR